MDFRAATLPIRRTLTIIRTGTIDDRTFIIILIPVHIRTTTVPHMGTVGTGPTAVITAAIITRASGQEARLRCCCLKPCLHEAAKIWEKITGSVDHHHRE